MTVLLNSRPSQEDIARPLHDLLPDDDALTPVLVLARFCVRLQNGRAGLLDLYKQRIVIRRHVGRHEAQGAHASSASSLIG